MEAGHTKFTSDWHFGLWKVKWRNSTVETLDEIASSVTNHHNEPQLVDDDQKPVKFFDWSSYLKQFFKPITPENLSSFQVCACTCNFISCMNP